MDSVLKHGMMKDSTGLNSEELKFLKCLRSVLPASPPFCSVLLTLSRQSRQCNKNGLNLLAMFTVAPHTAMQLSSTNSLDLIPDLTSLTVMYNSNQHLIQIDLKPRMSARDVTQTCCVTPTTESREITLHD